MIRLFDIFKAFFKIGLILLGGGYVMVPVLSEELARKRGWLKEAEVVDYYCISQCLPGIIAINMTVLAGYKLRKIKGVFAAVSGLIFSPVLTIIIIAQILNYLLEISFIQSIFWGANLSVIVLIYLAVRDIWKKSIIDTFCVLWFIFMLVLSLKDVSPVFLIALSFALGIAMQYVKKAKNKGERA